nr:DUF1284 domain-containing protein [Desulfobacterales bacterium]
MTLNLRAHHIFCVPFLDAVFPDRGEEFYKIEQMIKKVMLSDDERTHIKVTEGVDQLCKECPLCKNNRCQSTDGDEAVVRKWDALIMEELGIKTGEIFEAGEIRGVINQNAPLSVCFRCKWRKDCQMGRKTDKKMSKVQDI